jgi:hypothetical protein
MSEKKTKLMQDAEKAIANMELSEMESGKVRRDAKKEKKDKGQNAKGCGKGMQDRRNAEKREKNKAYKSKVEAREVDAKK